jgi:ankyrin repeat protein
MEPEVDEIPPLAFFFRYQRRGALMKHRNLFFAFITTILFIFSGCAAQTPLIKATSSDDSLAVQKLINEGANINEPDRRGMTPLMYATQYDNIEMVEALIKKGADVNIKDKEGCTPLYYAVSTGNLKLVKMLIDKGADVNLGDKYKRTPLMNVAYNSIDMVKLLLESGADVNARDYAGKTALMFASSPVIVEMLIDKGADVYAKSNEGYTVLQDAYYLKDIEKVAIIRKKTNWKEQSESSGLYEALKTPSFYKPEPNMFDVPKDKELAYNTAVYDCNHLSITGKTGLLIATGPVGYLAGMAFDAVTAPKKFQNCMEIMGFKCKNNCSK